VVLLVLITHEPTVAKAKKTGRLTKVLPRSFPSAKKQPLKPAKAHDRNIRTNIWQKMLNKRRFGKGAATTGKF
jgi:hypothetical protein